MSLRSCLFFFAALSLHASTALAIQTCELNGEPLDLNNGKSTEGKSGTVHCRDRDSGQIQREMEVRNGKFIGLVRFYRDGHLQQEYNVNERGNHDGRSREFSLTTGKVVRDENYRNGTTIGLVHRFTDDGKVSRISFHDDNGRELAVIEYTAQGQVRDLRCAVTPVFGKEVDESALCGFGHGGKPAAVSLYNAKGQMQGRLYYLEGVWVGKEDLWDNGKLSFQQTTAADGSQVEREFAEDGVKRHEVHWVKTTHGRQKESEQEFHESGSLVHEQHWQDGELVSEKSFYLNGQPHEEIVATQRDGKKIRHTKQFYDSGKLSFEGDFLAQDRYSEQAIGEQRSYHENGNLHAVESYDAKGHLTREQEFDQGGKKIRDDQVFEDGSRKSVGVAPNLK